MSYATLEMVLKGALILPLGALLIAAGLALAAVSYRIHAQRSLIE